MQESPGERIVEITEQAREKLHVLRSQDPEADRLAVWLEVTGVTGGEYTYRMTLGYREQARPDDAVEEHDGLAVVVPRESVDKLRGARIELEGDLVRGALAIENPNRPSIVGMALPVVPRPAPGGSPGAHAHHGHDAGHEADERVSPAVGRHASGQLSGPTAERVARILEDAINPAIAAHGGRADLVAVEDDTVYLRLSGGCQGCGMATVTLTQGIEVAITEAVPEVRRVVDVTDHAAGTNPYFEPAKK
jgi:Fe/S biogenesis protein NfuA